jgi:hypothetical protein
MVNQNEWYRTPFDRPHDISLVANYKITPRVSVSGNWLYLTGAPATFPVGRFEFMDNILPVYSKRNAERMPDYHRLDLSLSVKTKPRNKGLQQGEWVFGVYNAYARKNAWVINFEQKKNYKTQAVKTYLFSAVPSITYNFKF